MSTVAEPWRNRFLAGFVLAGLCMMGAAASTATAQQFGKEPGPFPAKNVVTKFTNKKNFKLPVANLTPAERSKLKALCLYCRTPNTNWVRCATIDPMNEYFVYKAEQDGEYWFIVASEDRSGRVYPSLEEMHHPNLRVIIDTRSPTITIDEVQKLPQGVMLQCSMQAQFPDPESLRVVCKNSSGTETTANPMTGRPGMFLITPQDGIPLRVVGYDLCKNAASQSLFLDKLANGAAGASAGAGQSEPADWRGKQTEPILANSSPLPTNPPAIVPEIKNEMPNESRPAFKADMINPEAGNPQAFPPAPIVNPQPLPVVPEFTPQQPSPAATTSIGLPSGNRTILPTTQAFIEYRVDQLGSSGIGKVQVYMTSDQGQSWTLLKEDFTKRSPVEIKLPGEGVFGINVVLTNGYGFGGNPPRSGEAPSCLIEVDSTRPAVQIQPPEILLDGAGLEIRWTASDRNMSAEPITLLYRTSPGARWEPIARGVKNDGHYRWAFPRNVGTQFFFRVEAVDQVGNVGHSETPNALTLDMTVPQATVIRVSGSR
jgi:hypothetical protein